jgi:hypothetical protein
MRTLVVILGLLLPSVAVAAPKGKKAADSPEAVVARIEAKWGKSSPAAVDARLLLADERHGAMRWLETTVGPVAVLEGAAVLVIPPSGKPHWWIGDPSASERYKPPEGEAVAGEGGAALALATPHDLALSTPNGLTPWKFAPVSPTPQGGGKGVRKDRVDLVFTYSNPLDRVDGVRFVSVTRDAVLWEESPAREGTALIDLDGDVHADRVRRLHQNFAECIMNVCDAVWYELDRGDGKGGFQLAPASVAKVAYGKLARGVQTRLEAETVCADWRNEAFELYRYALLGGIEVKEARAILAKTAKEPKLAACGTCPELSAAETQEARRDAEACHRSKDVLTCLDNAAALTPPVFENCVK